MIARAVASETRRIVCAVCGEGPISGGPGYLVKAGERYQHGDARTCAYVIRRRIEERRARPAWIRFWLLIRDVVGR